MNHLELAGSSPALVEGPASDDINIKTHSLVNFQNTSGTTVASLDQSGNLTISGTIDGVDIATDVVANTAKTSITTEQANAITANTAKETNTATDIGVTANSGGLTITSSDGLDGAIPAATTTSWGAMTSNDKTEIVYNASNISTNTNNITTNASSIEAIKADNWVTAARIMDQNVSTAKIQDGGITEVKILDDAVTADKIADNAITTTKITDGHVTGNKLEGGAVTTNKIGDSQVTAAKIADNAITTSKITDGHVTGNKLEGGAVTTAKIGDAQVTTAKIADGNVTGNKLEGGAVTTGKVGDNQITTAKIADNAITTAKITDGHVTGNKLEGGAVTTGKVGDNQITTAKIADDAITSDKIADNAIVTASITDGHVTGNKLEGGAVTTGKIGDSQVTADKIASNAITTAKITDGHVTGNKLEGGAVTTAKIGDDQVTEDKLADSINSAIAANTAKVSFPTGDVTIGGDLTVTGNDIKDNDGTTCITFDSAGNTTIAGELTVTDLEITDDLTLGDDVNINATGILYLAGAGNGEYITSAGPNTISIVAVSKVILDADTDVDGDLEVDGAVRTNLLGSRTDVDMTISAKGNLDFVVDSDNNETSQKFTFNNGGGGGVDEVASIDESGNLQLDGGASIRGARNTEIVEISDFQVTSDSFIQMSASGNTDDHRLGLKLKHNADTYGFTVQSQDGVDSLHGLNVLRHEGSAGGTSALFIERDNGDVGVGNTAPTVKLDVTGEIKSSGDVTVGGDVTCDGVITAKQRHIINCGWNGVSTPLAWLPFGYGGTGEAYYFSDNSGYLESGGIVAPCDGYVESVVIRCEEAAGSTEVGVHIAPAGTEVPADDDDSFISPAVDMAADDTGYKFSGFVDNSSNTNSFSAGDVIMISFNPTSACGDAVATAVLVLDWNNTL
jgi:hypothetical protein